MFTSPQFTAHQLSLTEFLQLLLSLSDKHSVHIVILQSFSDMRSVHISPVHSLSSYSLTGRVFTASTVIPFGRQSIHISQSTASAVIPCDRQSTHISLITASAVIPWQSIHISQITALASFPLTGKVFTSPSSQRWQSFPLTGRVFTSPRSQRRQSFHCLTGTVLTYIVQSLFARQNVYSFFFFSVHRVYSHLDKSFSNHSSFESLFLTGNRSLYIRVPCDRNIKQCLVS
jgi:hypothetical protein